MAKYSYESLKADYERLWSGMSISASQRPAVESAAGRVLLNKPRYLAVERETGVPWFVIGIIHKMEANLSFSKHLHNGDSLKARTRLVPAGRPKGGTPPFTWEFSAADALRYDGLDKIKDWSIPRVAWCLEKYNGFGSRARGVPSAYLWSFSNRYVQGKYVRDGVWSSTAVSQQTGGMVLLKELMRQDSSISLSLGGIKEQQPATATQANEDESLPYSEPKTATQSRTIFATIVGFLAWCGAKFVEWSGVLGDVADAAQEAIDPVTRFLEMLAVNSPVILGYLTAAALLVALLARVDDYWKGNR